MSSNLEFWSIEVVEWFAGFVWTFALSLYVVAFENKNIIYFFDFYACKLETNF